MDNIKDGIIKSVVDKFIERSNVGIQKYGKTLENNELTTLQWLIHAQEEVMDLVNYLEKLIQIERNKVADSKD
jgi:hypothetical protein